MASAILEEYIEAIYKLAEKGPVRPTLIAESVGVSGPTVTATLRRLESRGLITRERGEVVLSPEGHTLALDIIRRHRISERFLVDVLGLSWDEAHEDACMLEHALSPRVLGKLEAFLENPEVCPHGHPIPTAEGVVNHVKTAPLYEFEAGAEVRIVKVVEDDDEMLAYLGSMGMFPGRRLKILNIAPFGGPLTVEVAGQIHAIGKEVAGNIFVSEEPGSQ